MFAPFVLVITHAIREEIATDDHGFEPYAFEMSAAWVHVQTILVVTSAIISERFRKGALAAMGFTLAVITFFFGYRPKRAKRASENASSETPRRHRRRGPDRFWSELAIQDWVCLLYLATLLAFTVAGEGPRRRAALGWLSLDLFVFFGALVLTRAKILRDASGSALVYRLGLFAAVFGSFAHLQFVLPTARTATVDADLYALDLQLFHLEPAEAMDRFVTTATTEWFSFFYFSYFVILAVHILPAMFATRNMRLLSELGLGIILLFCIAHVLYILVPGHGPYHHLASHFTRELDGPFWWPLVKKTVDSVEVSARTDIFPSLHTAAPVYLAFFSIRHRREWPFRFTWIPTCLFASQIVISTMFLRWHYLIDVLAGLILAAEVSIYARRIAAWESGRREAANKEPVWTAPWLSDDP